MAGAHAIHNGLSYVDETHEILHGSKVAYGILVQLAYTGDDDEIRALFAKFSNNTIASCELMTPSLTSCIIRSRSFISICLHPHWVHGFIYILIMPRNRRECIGPKVDI